MLLYLDTNERHYLWEQRFLIETSSNRKEASY